MKNTSGFTMIELLMAIALMSILSSLALPMMVEFRNEARAAVVRENLLSMRGGIKAQIQQSMLRCNVSILDSWQTPGGTPFFEALGENMYHNDITYYSNDPQYKICDTNQVPENSRKGWSVQGNKASNLTVCWDEDTGFCGSIDNGPLGEHPTNPFVDQEGAKNTYEMLHITNDMIETLGDVCAVAVSFLVTSHWLYNIDTGEIFAGTDTPGVHECTF